MKKFKTLLLTLLAVGTLGLTSCSLFDDSDIAIHNEFNPSTPVEPDDPTAVYAQGVKGKEINDVPNALCFKSINYSENDKVLNTYKTGGVNHTEYNVNGGQDYEGSKSKNNYDLYVPSAAPKNNKHVVILFIHGGAWVSGFKTDVNPYVFEFAKKGYITATLKYTLLKRSMDDTSLSIFRNLDEIDACIKSIKLALQDLGYDTTKTNLVVGGASSGAHLAMLYSYSRGQNSALPIRFIVDAVGPVDIKPDSWLSFKNATDAVLDAGLTYSAINSQAAADNLGRLPIAGDSVNWNEYQTMRIANGMCGLPYTLAQVEASTNEAKENIVNPNAASNSMTKAGGGEDQLSVTYWIKNTNKLPIICAYAGKDSIVGIAQYATLEHKLDEVGVEHEYFYFRDSNHTEISKEANEPQYNAFVNKIAEWCTSKI